MGIDTYTQVCIWQRPKCSIFMKEKDSQWSIDYLCLHACDQINLINQLPVICACMAHVSYVDCTVSMPAWSILNKGQMSDPSHVYVPCNERLGCTRMHALEPDPTHRPRTAALRARPPHPYKLNSRRRTYLLSIYPQDEEGRLNNNFAATSVARIYPYYGGARAR